MDANLLWDSLLEDLEEQFDTDIFNDLFKNNEAHTVKNGYLVVIVPSAYVKTRINKFYLNKLNEMLAKYTDGEKINLKFLLKDEIVDKSITSPQKIKPYRNNINANYNFNSFVVGSSNRFAYQMALKVADQPGQMVNPLYIFGSVGLGKTHLMEAIGNYILDQDVNRKVLYVKASEFMEDYSKMCKRIMSEDDFNEKYRNLDVLLMDDIQTLEVGIKSQMEFFKIFDILFTQNKQIVITSDRKAKELNIMERLTSRFEDGLTVDVQIPNLEHRQNIIKKKLEEVGYENVDQDVLEYIAEQFNNNIREIEGAVNRLVYYCETCDLPINLDTCKEALSILISNKKGPSLSQDNYYQKVIDIIANYYSITYSDITGNKRTANFVMPRQIAMYILKNNFGLAYKKIGGLFGGKDHATVISSCNKIETELKTNNELKLAIDAINKKISTE